MTMINVPHSQTPRPRRGGWELCTILKTGILTLNSLVHTEKYFIGNHFIMRGRGLGTRLGYEAGN